MKKTNAQLIYACNLLEAEVSLLKNSLTEKNRIITMQAEDIQKLRDEIIKFNKLELDYDSTTESIKKLESEIANLGRNITIYYRLLSALNLELS